MQYLNSWNPDETPSNSATRPDPSCLTRGNYFYKIFCNFLGVWKQKKTKIEADNNLITWYGLTHATAIKHLPRLIWMNVDYGIKFFLQSRVNLASRLYSNPHLVCTSATTTNIDPLQNTCRNVAGSQKYSRLSISRTRISRILWITNGLSESKIHFDCFLQP